MRSSHKVLLLGMLGVLAQATSILLSIVLVRFYEPEDYGTLRQAFFVADTVTVVTLLALPASLLYFMPGLDRGRQKGLVTQTILLLGLLSFTGSVVLWLLSDHVAVFFKNPDLTVVLISFSFYPFLSASMQFLSSMYLGLDRYKSASWAAAISALAKFMVIVLAAMLGADLFLLMNVVMAYMAIQLTVIVGMAWFEFRSAPAIFDRDSVSRQMAYAVPLGFSGIVWFIGKEIDKYFLAAFVSPALYAVYAVGALEIPVFQQVSTAISVVLVPRIAETAREGRHGELPELWREVIRKSALVFVPSFALLSLLARPLIVTLYTIEYAQAVPVFQAYLLLILARIFTPNMILLGLGKTRVVMWMSILFVAANTTFNLLALQVLEMGIVGPAIATVLAFSVMNAVGTLAATRQLGIRAIDIVPVRYLLYSSLLALTAFGVGTIASMTVEAEWLKGVVGTIAFCLIYAPGARVLQLYTRDDVELLLGRFRRRV